MRLFTAIEVPAGVKLRLSAVLDRLRPMANLAWSPLENLHVTIKFIGEWPQERVNEIGTALGAVPADGPIQLAVRGLGWFPNARNPKVLWAGVESGEDLDQLALGTERNLAALGVPVENRDFHPHLTLARRRDAVSIELLKKEVADLSSGHLSAGDSSPDPATPVDFGSFRAESFFLYLSKGGKYVKLQEFPLP